MKRFLATLFFLLVAVFVLPNAGNRHAHFEAIEDGHVVETSTAEIVP